MRTSTFTPLRRAVCGIVAFSTALLAVFASTTAIYAATTSTSNISLPVSEVGFISCARDGAGEYVELNGEMHLLTHTTLDNAGGAHITYHFNYQGVSGVGLTSGDKYRASETFQGHANALNLPYVFNINDNFHVVGQGPGNNFTIHAQVHLTVNANGEATAYVDTIRMECRTTGNAPTPTPTPTPNPYPGP